MVFAKFIAAHKLFVFVMRAAIPTIDETEKPAYHSADDVMLEYVHVKLCAMI
jgi:hypothetical protein